MSLSISFHSELQKSIFLWLQVNCNLTIEEKCAHIKSLLINANLDAATLLHYAAVGFISNEALMVNTNLSNENLMLLIKGTKEFTQRIAHKQKSSFGGRGKAQKYVISKVEIQKIWASGKYKSRDLCAEQECAALKLSFSTARKALRNTPDPLANS